MDKETIEILTNTINVLGNIEVKGKTNLLNLIGCISILEDLQKKYIKHISETENKSAAAVKE